MISKETYHLPCSAEAAYNAAVKVFQTSYPMRKIHQEEYVPSLLSCAVTFTSLKTMVKVSFSIHVTKKDDQHCFFTISCINVGSTSGPYVAIDQMYFMDELMKELGIDGIAQEF